MRGSLNGGALRTSVPRGRNHNTARSREMTRAVYSRLFSAGRAMHSDARGKPYGRDASGQRFRSPDDVPLARGVRDRENDSTRRAAA